jgi:hypothetical protein
VCGAGLRTGKVTNYSNAPGRDDEPEGIFPDDGKSTCVEPDRESGMGKKGHQYVDIWKLALGGGRMEQLTRFNRYPGFKAPNPVVSDGGRYMAFQMAKVGDKARVGRGIFLYDFAKAPKAPR